MSEGLKELRVLMGMASRFPTVLEASIQALDSLLEAGDDPSHGASTRANELSKTAHATGSTGDHQDAKAQHELAHDVLTRTLKGLPAVHHDRTRVETQIRHHEKLIGIHGRIIAGRGSQKQQA